MNRNQKRAFLSGQFAFENLSDADIDYLTDKAQTRVVEAGEAIFFKGDPTTGLMAVVSGSVQIRTVSEDGKEFLLNAMQAGEMLGEIGAIDGGARTADAIAVEQALIMTIGREPFLEIVRRNPDFSISVMELLCGRIRATSEQAEDLALLDLKTRLAKKLVSLAEAGNDAAGSGDIVLRLTQSEIGTMMGTTREAINKHLSIWAKNGLISLGRNEIVIHDQEGLHRVFDT